MKMRDTTLEANNKAEMQNYYLYHIESPGERWAIGVEQVTPDCFNVSVLLREPDWDVYGTIRYWAFDERTLAEARYLQLQGIFADLDENATIPAVTRALPAQERPERPQDDEA